MNILLRKALGKSIGLWPRLSYPIYVRWLHWQHARYKLERGIVCLTFDNDYPEDHEAAGSLLPLLERSGVTATWGAVGGWMSEYRGVYERLLGAGHELMNHSWSHPDNALLRPGDPRKFSQLSSAEVEAELVRAHEACHDLFRYEMCGFRLPHYSFNPAVPQVLRRLGYRYTSGELSVRAASLGTPYVTAAGLVEIPLAGLPRRPDRIVESYRLFRAPDGLYSDESQFFGDLRDLLAVTARWRLITCLYLDAGDVIRLSRPGFAAYLDEIRRHDVEARTLAEVATLVRAAEGAA